MAPRQNDPQYKLRMTPEIKAGLEAACAKSGRSFNAEILYRLERSLFEETTEGTMREMHWTRRIVHETVDRLLEDISKAPDILARIEEQRENSRDVAAHDAEFLKSTAPGFGRAVKREGQKHE